MCRALLLLSLALAAPLAGAPSTAPQVAPGTVVRWPGEGLTRCGMAGAKWDPLDGACWYAIDLLTPAGGPELGRWSGGVLETRGVRVADYPYPVQHIELEDDSRVSLSAEDLARVQRENARIGRLWGRRGAPGFSLPLAAPLTRLPAGGGEVALTGDFFFSGKSVFLDHGDGLVTMYFHLSRLDVVEGDVVDRGRVIGAVGQTGRATGPHLHFAARWRGARVDPALLLDPSTVLELR